MNRCETIVTEEEDKEEERGTIMKALEVWLPEMDSEECHGGYEEERTEEGK